MYEPKSLPHPGPLEQISENTVAIHHGKLYAGYVSKRNEIVQKLEGVDLTAANPTYSELRALKAEETFAANGMVLHETYFDCVGQPNDEAPTLQARLAKDFGSVQRWWDYFLACGMAARGWVVLAWDTSDGRLAVYTGDAHNQGGVWGCVLVATLDVYEHAYFIDHGSDRKAYLAAYRKNFNWAAAERRFRAAAQA